MRSSAVWPLVRCPSQSRDFSDDASNIDLGGQSMPLARRIIDHSKPGQFTLGGGRHRSKYQLLVPAPSVLLVENCRGRLETLDAHSRRLSVASRVA